MRGRVKVRMRPIRKCLKFRAMIFMKLQQLRWKLRFTVSVVCGGCGKLVPHSGHRVVSLGFSHFISDKIISYQQLIFNIG